MSQFFGEFDGNWVDKSPLHSKPLNEPYRLWLLKNSICLKTDPKGVTRNVSEIGETRL